MTLGLILPNMLIWGNISPVFDSFDSVPDKTAVLSSLTVQVAPRWDKTVKYG